MLLLKDLCQSNFHFSEQDHLNDLDRAEDRKGNRIVIITALTHTYRENILSDPFYLEGSELTGKICWPIANLIPVAFILCH